VLKKQICVIRLAQL